MMLLQRLLINGFFLNSHTHTHTHTHTPSFHHSCIHTSIHTLSLASMCVPPLTSNRPYATNQANSGTPSRHPSSPRLTRFFRYHRCLRRQRKCALNPWREHVDPPRAVHVVRRVMIATSNRWTTRPPTPSSTSRLQLHLHRLQQIRRVLRKLLSHSLRVNLLP